MKNHLTSLLALALLSLVFGCAGPINRAIIHGSTEDDLVKAGFKSIPVTEGQENSLQGFPQGKVTSLQRHGIIYYVYPDLQHNRILMGGEEAYARYHQLVAHQLTPVTRPSGQLDRDWVSSGVWNN